MRGKEKWQKLFACWTRITPAYAGKSLSARKASDAYEDHPRVCGEKLLFFFDAASFIGSPPRMRGKGTLIACRSWLIGITPAYAGKSCVQRRNTNCIQDHPRVCGEKHLMILMDVLRPGSPPRMRGKAFLNNSPVFRIRITPAYAGKR